MAIRDAGAVQWLPRPQPCVESVPGRIGLITLDAKHAGERNAGNPPVAFDEAGARHVSTVAELRSSAKALGQPPAPKGGAPVLDPTIKGAGNKSSVGVLVERTSRLVLLARMADATAESALAGFTAKLNAIAAPMRQSLTYDQGKEMARHRELAAATGVRVYFGRSSSLIEPDSHSCSCA